MINWTEFHKGVINYLEKDISEDRNSSQYEIIKAPPSESLFVVAGPGSGKTTSMVLKVLKLIFVEDIEPPSIVAITFTRKAAAELKSRILGWGDQLRNGLIINCPTAKDKLEKIDFNKVITGTLDSLSEDILREYRLPGNPPPNVIEDFVSNALMTKFGLFKDDRYKNDNLENYIASLRGRYNLNLSTKSSVLRNIKDRCYNDCVDTENLLKSCNDLGLSIAFDAINDYEEKLDEKLLYDFVKVESEFLQKLRSGQLNDFLLNIRFVLVDEYQDTNLLQEQIYFELAKAAIENDGSFTVVGDDDQSLYRFRGATVDLFQSFKERSSAQLKINSTSKYLTKNYRSSQNIVDFCNEFIFLDRRYQSARVAGKPQIVFSRKEDCTDYPIFGMFRDDIDILSQDLSTFINATLSESGYQVKDNTGSVLFDIKIDSKNGSPSDIAFLCSSPQEINSSNKERFPYNLREYLNNYGIEVFNPRGQNLNLIPEVRILCGLILECIDPIGKVQESNSFPDEAHIMFDQWRSEASEYMNRRDITPNLKVFVEAWKKRMPLHKKKWDTREVPIIDLVYKLITWIPNMQNDIEGLVYVEAITRTISQSAMFSSFESQIVIDSEDEDLEKASIKEAYWNMFVPIATGAIEIDEELLETLPNNRINIMSIHQAKGLEFPLLIIDVGTDFKTKHKSQAFKRFPVDDEGEVCKLEDKLRSFCPLGTTARSPKDRLFDDLIRLYFVGFSRAKDVLLLVGLNSVKDGYSIKSGSREIPNVATGWNRDEEWIWGKGLNNLFHI